MVNPLPTSNQLEVYYKKQQANGNYNFSNAIQRYDVDMGIYDIASKLNFKSNAQLSVLDIGCFTGQLLSIFKDNKWRVNGLEFQKKAAEYGIEKFGIDIRVGTPSCAQPISNGYDLITACGLIEHLNDLNEFRETIQTSLKDGGYLLIQTPDYGSSIAKILGKFWPPLEPPEHIFYFNESNLDAFFADIGVTKVVAMPHVKKLRLGYVLNQFNHWGKSLSFITNFISKILPTGIKNIKLPFYGGELIWIGQLSNEGKERLSYT